DNLTEITSAKAEITVIAVKAAAQIDLDFGELPVDSVTVNSHAMPYERANGRLNIKLARPTRRGENLIVVVSYHGKPKDGLILSTDKAGKPSAVGDNWPNRVHHWIPSLDHPSAKATVTFLVTAPAQNEVVANGRLDRVENNPAMMRTWT